MADKQQKRMSFILLVLVISAIAGLFGAAAALLASPGYSCAAQYPAEERGD